LHHNYFSFFKFVKQHFGVLFPFDLTDWNDKAMLSQELDPDLHIISFLLGVLVLGGSLVEDSVLRTSLGVDDAKQRVNVLLAPIHDKIAQI
jgi:hypothetical protein